MGYVLPNETFDAVTWARNMTINAEQINDLIVATFIRGYEHWWNIQNGTPAHSAENMQACLRACPAAVDIMNDAAAFRTFANTSFPGALPEKYHAPPYDISVDGEGKLVVGEVLEAWKVQVVENEQGEL